IARAVNEVTASGALYFSSAGNSGNKDAGTSGTWEGDFADAGDAESPIPLAGRLHSFGSNTFNVLTPDGGDGRADLFWTDPLGASANDYDLFVLDSTGANVVDFSIEYQTGTQYPYESVDTVN